MSASTENNQGFCGVAPGGGARMSTQEVWQGIGEVAGQVRTLADLHTSLQSALQATLLSTGWHLKPTPD